MADVKLTNYFFVSVENLPTKLVILIYFNQWSRDLEFQLGSKTLTDTKD